MTDDPPDLAARAAARLAALRKYSVPDDASKVKYRLFPDELEDSDLIFFHGTHIDNRDPILLKGFEIPAKKDASALPTVSFATKSLDSYNHIMIQRSHKKPGDYCIFVVKYPRLNFAHLPPPGEEIHDAKLDPAPEIIGYMFVPTSHRWT